MHILLPLHVSAILAWRSRSCSANISNILDQAARHHTIPPDLTKKWIEHDQNELTVPLERVQSRSLAFYVENAVNVSLSDVVDKMSTPRLRRSYPSHKASFISLCIVLIIASAVHGVKYSSKYKNTDLISDRTHKNVTDIKSASEKEESVEDFWPVKIFNCVGDRGVEKCLKIFLIRRIEHVVDVLKREKHNNNVSIEFDVISEIKENFKWEDYKGFGEGDLNKMLFRKVEEIFKDKKTKLVLDPGVDIEVMPDDDGNMMLNIKKDSELQLPRGSSGGSGGSKFPKKMFYRLIPMLLIPPLIMSAILPFVLPAMKIMILWVGMLNQVALMASVFTLMRNYAFQEPTHEKRVIYVNDGYKNEKKPIVHHGGFHGPPQKGPPPHHEDHFHQHQYHGFPPFSKPGYEEEFEDEDFGNEHGFHPSFDEEYDRKGVHLVKNRPQAVNNLNQGVRQKVTKYPG